MKKEVPLIQTRLFDQRPHGPGPLGQAALYVEVERLQTAKDDISENWSRKSPYESTKQQGGTPRRQSRCATHL